MLQTCKLTNKKWKKSSVAKKKSFIGLATGSFKWKSEGQFTYLVFFCLCYLLQIHVRQLSLKQCCLVLMVKTAVSLNKPMYQPSLKIYASLAFTNSLKGVNFINVKRTRFSHERYFSSFF